MADNLADGLAWSFYFGYLKFVLPALKGQIDETEKYRSKIDAQKLFIIIPKNCQVFDKISNKDTDPNGLIEGLDNLAALKKNRGGIQDRIYRHTVHCITEKKPGGKDKKHFCVMEYATPLMTLLDMSNDSNAGLSKEERDRQVVLFTNKLKKILEEDKDCRGKYELITFSGEPGQDLGKIMLDALNGRYMLDALSEPYLEMTSRYGRQHQIPPPSKPQREQSLTSNSSSASMNSIFISRYATDFEHELCLGKGGFGVVFQAKNKLDDCQYAIKRVRLPNCDEAREKVMREVKALAKLEHPSIVRYFNAWFEAPPVGWQEDNDKIYLGDRTCTDMNLDSEVNEHPSISEGDLIDSNMVIRKRKKTSSSTKSKHSLSNCSEDKDGRHATLTAAQEDLSVPLNVHQLENEAFLPDADTSGSFGVEFIDSSDFGVTDTSQQDHDSNDDDDDDDDHDAHDDHDDHDANDDHDDTDGGIVFSSHFTEGDNPDVGPLSSKSSTSSSCKSLSRSFTTSEQSLLLGMHHKCKSEKCTKDTLQAPLYLFIQMQLCQRDSLKDWLKSNTERDHSSCLNVFDQIVNAVEYFHGRGMMHRDLKPSNIFFSLDGSVKVGDFGLVTASVQEPSDNPNKGKNGFIDGNHTGQVGTHLYMSPEQIKGKAYSYKVDVFSLGLIFFELFHTFSTEMERIKVLIDVKRKVIPEEFESKMALQAELVKWMLSESPKNRPTATEILASETYKNIVKDVTAKS